MSAHARALNIVHDEDLDNLLQELGIYDKLVNDDLHCIVCEIIVTRVNLGFIFLISNEVKICCDSLDCFSNAQILIKEISGNE